MKLKHTLIVLMVGIAILTLIGCAIDTPPKEELPEKEEVPDEFSINGFDETNDSEFDEFNFELGLDSK